jgi:hypothetical protein
MLYLRLCGRILSRRTSDPFSIAVLFEKRNDSARFPKEKQRRIPKDTPRKA